MEACKTWSSAALVDRKPYEHQLRVCAWMREAETRLDEELPLGIGNPRALAMPSSHGGQAIGGCVFLEPGMGKTLSLLMGAHYCGGITLVICPSSVVQVWVTEARRAFGRVDAALVMSSAGISAGDIVPLSRRRPICIVASFERIRSLYGSGGKALGASQGARNLRRLTLEFVKTHVQRLVVDECHMCRNTETSSFASVAAIPVSRRWLATGTPFHRNPGRDAAAYLALLGIPNADVQIEQVALRLSLLDVWQAPPISYERVFVQESMFDPQEQQRMCTEMGDGGFLAFVTRMQQAAADMRLFDESLEEEEDETMSSPCLLETEPVARPDKVGTAISMICSRNDEFFLVFSSMVRILDQVASELDTRSIQYCRIDGKANPKHPQRAHVAQKFQNGQGGRVALITKAAGGVGLTLTKATQVIIIDPSWNPQTDLQCVARAYRIGQDRPVKAHWLLSTSMYDCIVHHSAAQAAVMDAREIGEQDRDVGGYQAYLDSDPFATKVTQAFEACKQVREFQGCAVPLDLVGTFFSSLNPKNNNTANDTSSETTAPWQ